MVDRVTPPDALRVRNSERIDMLASFAASARTVRLAAALMGALAEHRMQKRLGQIGPGQRASFAHRSCLIPRK